jgi:hypothetical protein
MRPRLKSLSFVVAGTALLALAGCGTAQLSPAALNTAHSSPANPNPVENTPYDEPSQASCSGWLREGGTLMQGITAKYGEIDDCTALDGAWIITTDHEKSGIGTVVVYSCGSSCATQTPKALSDFKIYHPSSKVGTYERIAGTNPDGTVILKGGDGELAFNPQAGSFAPERGQ